MYYIHFIYLGLEFNWSRSKSNKKKYINSSRIKLVPQLVPQLAHVASCDWWRGDGRRHCSTNHNTPYGRIVVQVVTPALFIHPFIFFEGENK